MHRLLLPLCALALATCDATSVGGPRLEVEVAPLELAGLTDATYRLTARGTDGTLIWDRTLTSSRYGDSRGALTFVGPCDPASNPNQVTLELLSLSDGEGALGADEWVAPPAMTLPATCAENADTRVVFDLTIARSARQGFFDIGVTFDDIFCSAKLDCGATTDPLDDLILLHDPDSGERGPTAVLAFACTPTPDSGADTHLYLDDLEITCDDGVTVVAVGTPGIVDLSIAPSTDPNNLLFSAAVYRGVEGLASKAYWNVALGLNRDVFATVGTCTLRARATASDGPLPSAGAGFGPGGMIWPYIDWNVRLVEGGQRACTTHPIDRDDGDDGVDTVYPPNPNPIDRGFDPSGPHLVWQSPSTTFRIGETGTNTLELHQNGALVVPENGLATLTAEDPGCVTVAANVTLLAGTFGPPVTFTTPSIQPCTTRVFANHPLWGTAVASVRIEAPLVSLAGSPETVAMVAGASREAELHLQAFGDSEPVSPPPGNETVTLLVTDPTCVSAPATVTLGSTPSPFIVTGLVPGCTTSIIANHPIFGTFTLGVQVYTETTLELRSQPVDLLINPRATEDVEVWLARPGMLARVTVLAGTPAVQVSNDNPSCISAPDEVILVPGEQAQDLTITSVGFTPCTATITLTHPDYPAAEIASWGGDEVHVTVRAIVPSFTEDSITALAQDPVQAFFELSASPPSDAGPVVFSSSDESCASAPLPIPLNSNTTLYELQLQHGSAALPCTTTITAQTVFGNAEMTLTLGDTPVLTFVPELGEVNVGQPLLLTLALLVAGEPVRFPANSGLATITSSTPGCTNVPASVGFSATLTNSFHTTAGNTPCSTTVTATHATFGSADFALTVLPPPDLGPLHIDTFEHEDRVGAGLQARFMVSRDNLGLGLPSVSITVTSSDPAVSLSLTDSDPGASSIQANITTNEGGRYIYVRGAPGAVGSNVTLAATHPRFDTGTLDVAVVPPVFEPSGVWRIRSTTSSQTLSEDTFQVLVGVLDNSGDLARQNVSPDAAPLPVDLTVSDPAIAQLRTTNGVAATHTLSLAARKDISPSGVSIGGIALVYPVPPQNGTFTVTASSLDSTPTSRDHTDVIITATDNTLAVVDTTSRYRIGGGLQAQYRVNLTGSHPAMTVRVESTDPGMALVAANATDLGSAFIELPITTNATGVNFWVQAVPGRVGPVELAASAPNFVDGFVTTEIVPGVVSLSGLTLSRTGTSYLDIADDGMVLSVGIPTANDIHDFDITQAVAPRFAPLTLTVTKTVSASAALKRGGTSGDTVTVELAANTHTSTDQVLVDSSYPATPGTFTVTASAPDFIQTSSVSRATLNYNITPATTSIGEVQNPNTGNRVGAGLSLRLRLTTNQTPPGSPPIRIRSSDPSLAVVSMNPTTPGAAYLDTSFATATIDFYVHGITGQSGTVQIIAECQNPATCVVPTASIGIAVVPVVPVLTMNVTSFSTSTVETETDTALRVEFNVNSVANGLVPQVVSGTAGTLPVTLSVSAAAQTIVSLVASSGTEGPTIVEQVATGISRTPGVGAGTIYFRLVPRVPAGNYPITLSGTVPGSSVGTLGANVSSTQAYFTFGTPTSGNRVGAGFEHTVAIALNGLSGSPGTIDATVTSSDGGKVALSSAASNSPITSLPLVYNSAFSSRTIYVVGAGDANTPSSTTLTVSAPGATTATANWEVVRPTLRLVTNVNQSNYLNPLTLARTANGISYRLKSGVIRNDGTFVLQNPAYYGLTATITSDDISIIAVGPTTGTATNSSHTVGIAAGVPTSDVFALDPRGTAGTTTLRLIGQNVFMPAALEYSTITVNTN